MESFSLLKYWRAGGGAAAAAANMRTPTNADVNMRTTTNADANMRTTTNADANMGTTTIATSALRPSSETDDDDGGDGDEEGSFFDLEFSVPNDDVGENVDSTSESDEEERELNFTVSSSSDGRSDPSLSLSPSDDLFFKGRLVPLEPSSIVITTSDPDSKPPQFPVSLLKSATKFRVFMLGLKKPKSTPADPNAGASPKQNQQQSKFFIKFKVEEVPIVSLFSSSRNSGKAAKPQSEEYSTAEEKKFSKEVVQKYINKIKPLYVRVSKRYAEKLKFSGQLIPEGAVTKAGSNEEETTNGDEKSSKPKMPAGFRVVRKSLGKSKSSSSAVAAVPSPPVPPQRRDDSLLQQQDGIQGAIAHCKRSFNAASKGSSQSPLVRSKSDPSDDRGDKGNGDCV